MALYAHEPITTKVTFNKEIIRILNKRCLDCHRNPEKNIRPREYVYDLAWQPKEGQEFDPVALKQEYHVLSKYQMTNCSTCHH